MANREVPAPGERINVTLYNGDPKHRLCGLAVVARQSVGGFYFEPAEKTDDPDAQEGFCILAHGSGDNWEVLADPAAEPPFGEADPAQHPECFPAGADDPAPAPAPEAMNAAGNRKNVGKTKWVLTLRRMWPALRVVCQVTEMGAKKYSPDGWWNNELAEDDTCDAIVRHITAVFSDIYIDHHGEFHVGQNDPESGLPHWAHAAWNCLALGALRIKQANRGAFEESGK